MSLTNTSVKNLLNAATQSGLTSNGNSISGVATRNEESHSQNMYKTPQSSFKNYSETPSAPTKNKDSMRRSLFSNDTKSSSTSHSMMPPSQSARLFPSTPTNNIFSKDSMTAPSSKNTNLFSSKMSVPNNTPISTKNNDRFNQMVGLTSPNNSGKMASFLDASDDESEDDRMKTYYSESSGVSPRGERKSHSTSPTMFTEPVKSNHNSSTGTSMRSSLTSNQSSKRDENDSYDKKFMMRRNETMYSQPIKNSHASTTSTNSANLSIKDRIQSLRDQSGKSQTNTEKSSMSIDDRIQLLRDENKRRKSETSVASLHSPERKIFKSDASPQRNSYNDSKMFSKVSTQDKIKSMSRPVSPERNSQMSTQDKISALRKSSMSRTASPERNSYKESMTSKMSNGMTTQEKIAKLRESSLKRNSAMSSSKHDEERFSIDDVSKLEIDPKTIPKVVAKENRIKPHAAILTKYGIVTDKVFNDTTSNIVYMNAFTSSGLNFVIEISNKEGTALFLDDGHVLEVHTGEELDMGSKVIDSECEKLGTCGLFHKSGNKVTVSNRRNGGMHKTSYVINSLESEKSMLEQDGIVAVPIVKFENLEAGEAVVNQILAELEITCTNYYRLAFAESRAMLNTSALDMFALQKIVSDYITDCNVAENNFQYKESIAMANLKLYNTLGNVEAFHEVAAARKDMLEAMKKCIVNNRELSHLVEKLSESKNAVIGKLDKLRTLASPYSV